MSLNTTPRTFVTGEIETAAIFNAEVRDAITGIQAAWTAWTPTLTGITLGNGTQVARYQRIGKNILFYWDLTLGSTSAITGTPSITLPVAALSVSAVRRMTCGYLDFSTGAVHAGLTFNESTTAASLSYGASPLSAVSATGPFTWAVSDVLHAHGMYEAA